MALFATTVITLGPNPDSPTPSTGVFARAYVTDARDSADALKAAVRAGVRANPEREFHDSATQKIPAEVIREGAAAGNFHGVKVTSVVLREAGRNDGELTAFVHASSKFENEAKYVAEEAARKAHPDKEVALSQTVKVPDAVVRKAAAELDGGRERGSEAGSRPAVPKPMDVERYATEAVNQFRQKALEVGPERARDATLYALMRGAGGGGVVSPSVAVSVGGAAIDSYAERRREGVSHAESRGYAAAETARRFDGYGRDREQAGATKQREGASL